MRAKINKVDFMAHGLKLVSEANQREHWRVKLKRKHSQQIEMIVAINNNLRGREVRLPCKVKLTRIGPKALDKDNLAGAFKHCQDVLAKKLGVDDGDTSRVTWEYHQMPIGIREYGVKVSIESVNQP